MASEVKLFGHHFKRWQVATVGIGGALVTYLIWRQHKAGAAGSSAASDPNQVDPVTGLTDAQDIAQYGSVAAADAAMSPGAGTGTASYGYGSVGGGSSYGPVGSYGTTLGVTSGGGYASNAAWAQAVETGLVDIGYTSTDTASAVGRYLGGLSLTPDQQNIINVALAEYGPPPSGALPIIAAAQGTATSGSTTTTTTGGTTTSGTTSSGGGSAPAQTSTVSGGRILSLTTNDAVIAWTPHGPATSWNVTRVGPGGTITNHVTIPQATYSGLASGHNYEVTIQPLPAGQPGKIDFKTK